MDHPNIVKLFDLYEDDGHYFLIMELMTGGELFDQILAKEKFSEKEAREIVAPIFDALVYCHSLGIVHRDIKPENLLLSVQEEGISQVRVSDFGLARFIDDQTFANTTCGTPGYVAPEILLQKPYRENCDFWSVGVVLFILLSGSPPFYHEDNFELFEIIKTGKYSFSAPQWKNISAEAKDLISKLLLTDPEKRIAGKDILAHPWITGQVADSTNETADLKIGENMRKWHQKNTEQEQEKDDD